MLNPTLLAHGLGNTEFPVAIKSSAFNAVNRMHYACNTSGGEFTVMLPANPKPGFCIIFTDYAISFDTKPLTVNPNGKLIRGVADVYMIDTRGAVRHFMYLDAVWGWYVK